MDFPLPTDWPHSVEVVDDVVYVSHRGFGWRHDAKTGVLLEATQREGLLAGEGGLWSIDRDGNVVSWTPDGGPTLRWTLPGNTYDAAVQGERLWVVLADGLHAMTPDGLGRVVDPDALAVAVHGDRRAVLSKDGVMVFTAADRLVCTFSNHQAPKQAPDTQRIALDDHYMAVDWYDGFALLDANTCAVLRVAGRRSAMIGIDDGQLWSGDSNRLWSESLPDLERNFEFRGDRAEQVLAGPHGPVVWTGGAVYDGATGKRTDAGGYGALLVRDPDWLLSRQGKELVVRDASGAVIARHPTPKLGRLKVAAHIDGDLAVSDGHVVMRIGASPQQVVIEDSVNWLGRGPGGVLRVNTEDGPVWELAPGSSAPVRVSKLVRAGLEQQGATVSAVKHASLPGRRYSLIAQGDHTAVWDQDTLRVVGSPLPLVSKAAVSADGRWVAGVADETLLIVETATARVLWRVPGVVQAQQIHIGPRQVVVADKEGWLVADPVKGRSMRLAKVDSTTGLELMDQLRRWDVWDVSDGPARPKPGPGAVPVNEAAVAATLKDLHIISPGDPVCDDWSSGRGLASLVAAAERERLAEVMSRRCQPPASSGWDWPAEVTRENSPPPTLKDISLDFGAFDRLTGDYFGLPLRRGHPMLLLKLGDFVPKDIQQRLPADIDLVLAGDIAFPQAEVWLQLVSVDLDLRQRRIAVIDERDLQYLPSEMFAYEATLLGPGGKVLSQSDLDTVLNVAAQRAVHQPGAPAPLSATKLWTWRAPATLQKTLVVDGRVLVSDKGHIVALTPDGDVAWTRALERPGVLRPGPPMLLLSGGQSTVISAQDGAPGWSVTGEAYGRPGLSMCLNAGYAAVEVDTGEVYVGREGWPEASGPWPCNTTPSSFWGRGCQYVNVPGGTATCVPPTPVPRQPVPMGDLQISQDDLKVVATQSNGEVVWRLDAYGAQAFSENRILVRLPMSSEASNIWNGPLVAVDRSGQPRERLGPGDAVVVDGRVIITNGQTVTAFALP